MAILNALPNSLSFPFSSTPDPRIVVPSGMNDGEDFGSPEFWWKIGLSGFLVLLGGAFSG
jgi:hypothetical protein